MSSEKPKLTMIEGGRSDKNRQTAENLSSIGLISGIRNTIRTKGALVALLLGIGGVTLASNLRTERASLYSAQQEINKVAANVRAKCYELGCYCRQERRIRRVCESDCGGVVVTGNFYPEAPSVKVQFGDDVQIELCRRFISLSSNPVIEWEKDDGKIARAVIDPVRRVFATEAAHKLLGAAGFDSEDAPK